MNGHADRSTRTIGVRADIDAELAVEVAAHEVYHLTQSGRDPQAEEDTAANYGEWTADILVGDGRIAGVYPLFDMFPGEAFAGEAEPGDVLITHIERRTTVFRNRGSRDSPHWEPHSTPCPVSC